MLRSMLHTLLLLLAATVAVSALPASSTQPPAVVIWHGLGDRYDNPGLVSLGQDIKKVLGEDTFVYMVRVSNDSNADQKATLFGDINVELETVAHQLREMPELRQGFDAIGLSQGGVFLRGYVERYSLAKG